MVLEGSLNKCSLITKVSVIFTLRSMREIALKLLFASHLLDRLNATTMSQLASEFLKLCEAYYIEIL